MVSFFRNQLHISCPYTWFAFENKQSFFASHKKIHFEQVACSQVCIKNVKFAFSNSIKHLMYKHKNHFPKEFNVCFTLLETIKFSRNDVLPRIRIEKHSLHNQTQLNIWFKGLGERKNSSWDENVLCCMELNKTAFSKCYFFFSFFRKRSLSDMLLCYGKLTANNGVWIADRHKKIQKLLH